MWPFKRRKSEKLQKVVRWSNPLSSSALTNRLSNWFGPDVTEGGSIYGNVNLDVLRSRANDLYINNPHANSGVENLKARLIGEHGLSPIIKPHRYVQVPRDTLRKISRLNFPSNDPNLNVVIKGIINNQDKKLDAKRKYEMVIEVLWKDFAKDCNLNESTSFEALCTQAVRTFVRSGECFVRRKMLSSKDKSVVPFKLQLLDPNMVYTPRTDLAEGMIQGIKYTGATPTGYEFYANNPQSIYKSSETVMYNSDEICHIKRNLWEGQVHGLPFLTPCMVTLRDLAKVQNNEILRQTVAACFPVTIR